MNNLHNILTNPTLINYLIGAIAGGVATFLTAWLTKLSDWITIQSNRVQGHPVTAALAEIGQQTMVVTQDKVITEAEVKNTIKLALQKIGVEV